MRMERRLELGRLLKFVATVLFSGGTATKGTGQGLLKGLVHSAAQAAGWVSRSCDVEVAKKSVRKGDRKCRDQNI